MEFSMNKTREQAEVEIENLLGVIGQLQKVKSKEILSRFDCSISQFAILQLLNAKPEMNTTVVELAKTLEVNMSQATATRAVAALIEKNFLESKANSKDRRQSLISITQSGISHFCYLYEELTKVTGDAYREWSTQDLITFSTQLKSIYQVIQKR